MERYTCTLDQLSDEAEHMEERRRSLRHVCEDGPLVVNTSIIGPLLDLSLHGMSFQYFGDELDQIEYQELGIFAETQDIFINGLRTRTVRDCIIHDTSEFPLIIRKFRAVEFLELTPLQRHLIKQLLSTMPQLESHR